MAYSARRTHPGQQRHRQEGHAPAQREDEGVALEAGCRQGGGDEAVCVGRAGEGAKVVVGRGQGGGEGSLGDTLWPLTVCMHT
jgi:hypothetical protein